jgi:hypothetical protein
MALPTYNQRTVLRSPFLGFDTVLGPIPSAPFFAQPGHGLYHELYDATRDTAGNLYNAGGLALPPFTLPIESTFSALCSDLNPAFWASKTFDVTLSGLATGSTMIIDDSGANVASIVQSDFNAGEISVQFGALSGSSAPITNVSGNISGSSKLLSLADPKPFRLFYRTNRKNTVNIVGDPYVPSSPRIVAAWNGSDTFNTTLISPGSVSHAFSTAIAGVAAIPGHVPNPEALYVLVITCSGGISLFPAYYYDTLIYTTSGALMGITAHDNHSESATDYVEDTDYSRSMNSVVAWDGTIPDLIPAFNGTLSYSRYGSPSVSFGCSFSATLYELLPDW